MENLPGYKVPCGVYLTLKPFLLINKIFGISLRRHGNKNIFLYFDYILSILWTIFFIFSGSLDFISLGIFEEDKPIQPINEDSTSILNIEFKEDNKTLETEDHINNRPMALQVLIPMTVLTLYLSSILSVVMTSGMFRNTYVSVLESLSRVDDLLHS